MSDLSESTLKVQNSNLQGRNAFERAILLLEKQGEYDPDQGNFKKTFTDWEHINQRLGELCIHEFVEMCQINDQIQYIEKFINTNAGKHESVYRGYWGVRLPAEVKVFCELVSMHKMGYSVERNGEEMFRILGRYRNGDSRSMPSFLRKWVDSLNPQT
jgi:hypothetical protein